MAHTLEPQQVSCSTAFVVIPGMKEQSAAAAVSAISALHEVLALVFPAGEAFEILSALTGGIVVAPDRAPAIDERLGELANALTKAGVPAHVGITRGDAYRLPDVDGRPNYIGASVNRAARLAMASENKGCLIDPAYFRFVAGAARGQYALDPATCPLSIVKGKRDEVFDVHCVPVNRFPVPDTLNLVAHAAPSAANPRSRPAVTVAFDLPGFSKGDTLVVKTRFRTVVESLHALSKCGAIPGSEEFWYSPGGDGGILVLDVPKDDAYRAAMALLDRFDQESRAYRPDVQVHCRTGLHYGTVHIFAAADGAQRPTGPTLFAIDDMIGDSEAKATQFESLIVTDEIRGGIFGGASDRFNERFEPMKTLIEGPARGIPRYRGRVAASESRPSHGGGMTPPCPTGTETENSNPGNDGRFGERVPPAASKDVGRDGGHVPAPARGPSAGETPANGARAAFPRAKLQVFFLSALGQWTPALCHLLESSGASILPGTADRYESAAGSFKIHKWSMSMSEIEEVRNLQDGTTCLSPRNDEQGEFPPEEWLWVFVAPLPLAAKFHGRGLKVLGPAFSTESDVTLYVRNTEVRAASKRPAKLRIGVISDDITSTIMVKTVLGLDAGREGDDLLLHPELLRENLSDLSPDLGKLRKCYDAKHDPSPHSRFLRLDPARAAELETTEFHAAVFTALEYDQLRKHHDLERIRHRRIITVDPIVAHYLDLDFVPRSAYMLHKGHYATTDYLRFATWLRGAFDACRTNCETRLPNGMRILWPEDDRAQEGQRRLIAAGVKLEVLQDLEDMRFDPVFPR